jgi:hypothetical protein
MPFPNIDYCIVCEGVREEARGKLTILGFYGLAPHVEILVGDMSQPLSVFFVMGFGSVDQQYNSIVQVVTPTRAVLLQTPATIRPSTGRAIVAVGHLARFPTAGRYAVRVLVGGETKLDTSFAVRPARPEELLGRVV